jgi:hypothetical protein
VLIRCCLDDLKRLRTVGHIAEKVILITLSLEIDKKTDEATTPRKRKRRNGDKLYRKRGRGSFDSALVVLAERYWPDKDERADVWSQFVDDSRYGWKLAQLEPHGILMTIQMQTRR